MQFKEKIETAALPLIAELRQRLAALPTIVVLNHYQLQHHLSQFDTSKFPDGFWTKWRYLWALLLSDGFREASPARDGKENFARIDELIEQIFELYAFGAVYEPGRSPGSEKEFLTRLGLGLKVREPDTLGFPDQIKSWALARFRPFNDSYFLPVFGLHFEELFQWIDDLIHLTEAKLNRWINDMVPIVADLKALQRQFADGMLGLQEVRNRGDLLQIGERLDSNGRDGEALHLLSEAEIQQSIPKSSLDTLIKQFGIKPGEIGPEFVFPHHENPLEYKLFVILPNASFYFVDPASAYRVMAKTFEYRILEDGKLRERYLRNRGRAMEGLVMESARKVFPKGAIYPNYYLQKGSLEKDLFIRDRNTVILIECKNSRVRAFTGTTDDLVKFESDFENSVQYGYEQHTRLNVVFWKMRKPHSSTRSGCLIFQ